MVFPSLCEITQLDDTVSKIKLTPTQIIIAGLFNSHPNTYIIKYRQCMSSTVHVADQLRGVMYQPGLGALLVGDQEKTYKELMRRMAIMYAGIPEFIRPPLERPPSSEMIVFNDRHNGFVQGLTAGGENPAVGFSPGYSVLSEYGLVEDCSRFDASFFPAVNRRPNARVRIETTPGKFGSPQYQMWLEALAGRGRFRALFLAWWRDLSCVSHNPPFDPATFRRTPEEEDYASRVDAFEQSAQGRPWWPYQGAHPIRDEQLWFRRISLETEFHGDVRLFASKYPLTPWDGWLVTESPMMPVDALARLRERPLVHVPDNEEVFTEEREPRAPYLLVADGAGYGKTGDPAGFLLFNMWDWRMCGVWLGREDPGVFSRRILRVRALYDADVVVETNKDGLAAALDVQACPKLYWSEGGQPGWFASETSKIMERTALVDMLRCNEVPVPFDVVLDHLSQWDGTTRAAPGGGRARHHFELAICMLIFAYAARTLAYPRRPRPRIIEAPKGMTIGQFDAYWKKPGRGRVLGDV
jgi:hypothetical protein